MCMHPKCQEVGKQILSAGSGWLPHFLMAIQFPKLFFNLNVKLFQVTSVTEFLLNPQILNIGNEICLVLYCT
jgi:hypothetical protein